MVNVVNVLATISVITLRWSLRRTAIIPDAKYVVSVNDQPVSEDNQTTAAENVYLCMREEEVSAKKQQVYVLYVCMFVCTVCVCVCGRIHSHRGDMKVFLNLV